MLMEWILYDNTNGWLQSFADKTAPSVSLPRGDMHIQMCSYGQMRRENVCMMSIHTKKKTTSRFNAVLLTHTQACQISLAHIWKLN